MFNEAMKRNLFLGESYEQLLKHGKDRTCPPFPGWEKIVYLYEYKVRKKGFLVCIIQNCSVCAMNTKDDNLHISFIPKEGKFTPGLKATTRM